MSGYDQSAAAPSANDETRTESTPAGEPRGEWVSVRAVAWVLDDAPCPSDLLPVLTAIARRCDDNGKGSRQRTAVIAEKAGKSRKQAQRDIVRLRELKLIEHGDQTLVAHLPEHERPVVYDLPLHIKGPKPVKGSRNPTGLKKDAVSVGDSDTPSHARGDLPSKGGGPMGGKPPTPLDGSTPIPSKGTPPSHPRDTEEALEEAFEQPVQQPSLSDAGSDRMALPAPCGPNKRERDQLGRRNNQQRNDDTRDILARHNCTGDDADIVIAHGNSIGDGKIKGPRWWETVEDNGHLPAFIEAALASAGCRLRSPADEGVAQAAALAHKYATQDERVGMFDRPWLNMATGRIEHGDPFKHATRSSDAARTRRNGYQPYRDPDDLSVYDQPL